MYVLMKLFIPIFSVAILSGALCFSAEPQSLLLDGIAAEVGGTRITIADVMAEAREFAYSQGKVDITSDPAFLKDVYSRSLSNLVDRALIMHEYEKLPTKIPDWYLNQRIERIIESSFDGDRSKLVAALESRGTNFQEWKKRRTDDMVFMTMRQQFIESNVKVRPADVAAVYEEKYATQKLPGHVKVSMIMFEAVEDGKALETAKAEVARLRAGADFAVSAKKYSREKHASEGGSWGYIEPEDELRKELVDALKPLAIGGVSDPVVVGGYIYILRKDDERSDLSVPLDAVREKIEEDLLEAAGSERFAAWMKRLSEKYTVRIFNPQ